MAPGFSLLLVEYLVHAYTNKARATLQTCRAKEIIEQKQSQMDPSERLTPEESEAAYTAVAYGAVKYNDLKGSRSAYV